jgi:hypothetical protein
MNIFGSLFVAFLMGNLWQNEWQLAKSKDGITVFTQQVHDSQYHGFRAVVCLKDSMNEILNVLRDVYKYPEWFAFTASVQFKQQVDNKLYFRMETDFPWPYQNEFKDYEMSFDELSDELISISLKGLNNSGDAPMLKKAKGNILLHKKQGDIELTFTFHSEPTQSIPAWLINPVIHELPYRTLQNLKHQLDSMKKRQ